MEEKIGWEEEISLFDLINVLLKRKWVILGVILIVLALSFLAWRFMPRTYKAEFEVSCAESSLPSEFEGNFTVLYNDGQMYALVPYSYNYVCQLCKMESTEDFLARLQDHEVLSSIVRELGVEEARKKSAFSLKVQRKQPEGVFLVTLSASDREPLQKMAERISGKIENGLLKFLREKHQRKTEFFQNLQKEVNKQYLAARDKLFAFVKEHNLQENILGASSKKTLSLDTSRDLLVFPQSLSFSSEKDKIASKEDSGDLEILDGYNLLLRDYAFRREINSLLTLSLPPTLEDGSYPFDGEVKVGEITYSGTGKSLKLNLAVGLVAGLFVGVLAAFFWEFWERERKARA
ncbi:MAG: Wzz/FepE/Etk N-terminal domain-containing protein [Candidatus Caldatribacteriaceae bacterium]